MTKTTVTVSVELAEELALRKRRGETYADVVRRALSALEALEEDDREELVADGGLDLRRELAGETWIGVEQPFGLSGAAPIVHLLDDAGGTRCGRPRTGLDLKHPSAIPETAEACSECRPAVAADGGAPAAEAGDLARGQTAIDVPLVRREVGSPQAGVDLPGIGIVQLTTAETAAVVLAAGIGSAAVLGLLVGAWR